MSSLIRLVAVLSGGCAILAMASGLALLEPALESIPPEASDALAVGIAATPGLVACPLAAAAVGLGVVACALGRPREMLAAVLGITLGSAIGMVVLAWWALLGCVWVWSAMGAPGW